jgi:hypothetical protein
MRFIFFAASLLLSSIAFALPDESDFRVVTSIPASAPGATGVVGCSLPDGRYLLWNGDEVFVQQTIGSGAFNAVASGYTGDPAFAVLSFDQDFVLLGAGFGNGVTANAYQFDFNAPQDYQSGSELTVPNHFAAAFLSSTLVAFDRGDFGSPAEIIVVDISGARDAHPPVTVLRLPQPNARSTVITKPNGSFSAAVAVHSGTLYVADSGNGQYKSFPVSSIISAYNANTTVAWSSGTDIGTPFAYPLGGVSGVTGSGSLVMAGFGSIVEVDPGTGNILTTYDPAGTSPFYGMVYNDTTEDFIAIEFPPNFGDPLIFHATVDGVGPLPAAGVLALLLTAAAIAALRIYRRRTARSPASPHIPR